MSKDNYQRGFEKMMEYAAPDDPSVLTHSKIAEDLKDIAPDVPRYMVEFAFGEIYTRPGLTKKEQALVTISSLVTLGADPQVELHIHTGLTAGLSQDEETVDHFVEQVKRMPQVLECHLMAGDCDFLLRIVVADLEAYRRFQVEYLNRIKGIQNVKTEIPMQRIKQSWQLPL